MFSVDKFNNNAVTLDEWLQFNTSVEKKRNLFIGMSSTLKYIHSNGYYVSSFSPSSIYIIDDSYSKIRFNFLEQMPDDFANRTSIVKQNIFDSAFFQIGIYTDCLNYLKKDFLINNFNDFIPFIPASDISYYRGVVQRGASVYFSDFCNELRNRELSSLGEQIGDGGNTLSGKSLVKSNGKSILSDPQLNSIYHFNQTKDAAFISFLLIPLFVSLFGIVFTLLALILRVF